MFFYYPKEMHTFGIDKSAPLLWTSKTVRFMTFYSILGFLRWLFFAVRDVKISAGQLCVMERNDQFIPKTEIFFI